ncbi:cytochrome b561 and DOMON domain-containing protein At4g12980-like [Amaranthus tricolor]|uniref:cytochrome b561 and DOMON domain-containing protein At4g12980-like n=1 Tax=Amaranthus tricolor TaxID=29722 RepID=UPI00258520D6|nr:cytochrome b561 and DOMON domain-containing protein At4g12980-like [Amaranthus tricolor]
MASLILSLFIILNSISLSFSSTCTSPKLTSSFTSCNELPSLGSSLHYSYNPTNKSLSVAFTATPSSPNGWVAWGINPTSTGMGGTQAILAFRNSDGSMSVKTFDISSYSSIVPGKLSYQVYDKKAVFNSADGSITIFATIENHGGKNNHVWQVGPSVTKDFPDKHDFKPANLNAKGVLDLSVSGGDSGSSTASPSSSDPITKKKNTHGILNAISWGLLFPVGAIIARYVRTFESADPAWFYVHVTCQISGYAIGVAGWATGLQLGSKSVEIVNKSHRYIGIALFALATLQIFALFLRPKKEHKLRFYWNIYHHSIGYAIIILGIINVFKGLTILDPAKKWKSTYVSILIVLGGITVLLEVFTWVVVLLRRSSRSTKPYA